MAITVRAFANANQAFVVWRPDGAIPDCAGFALYRRQNGAAPGTPVSAVTETGVPGAGSASAVDAGRGPGPSAKWPVGPIMDFAFVDLDVSEGDEVCYQVLPLQDASVHPPKEPPNGTWSNVVRVSPDAGPSFSVYFNRGIVASQWLTRGLSDLSNARGEAPAAHGTMPARQQQLSGALREAIRPSKPAESGEPVTPRSGAIRHALAGGLLDPLLALLREAKEQGHHVYVAIFLLNDDEIIDALIDLQDKVHVILANGRDTVSSDRPEAADDVDDENKEARDLLKRRLPAGHVIDRMLTDRRLAHNKFVVVCADEGQTPLKVWTGSGNWTLTGLCTQTNNALVCRQPEVAQFFMDQWKLLAAASKSKSKFSKALLAANGKSKPFPADNPTVTVWFAPVTPECEPQVRPGGASAPPDLPDLKHAAELIRGAQQAILFLMYTPAEREGLGSLYDVVMERAAAGDLHVQGVVDDWLGQDPNVRRIRRLRAGEAFDLDPKVVVPRALDSPAGAWEPELERYGRAIAHSKVVVVDPFGARPVVITGAHNLGPRASRCNDENLVIVQGDRAVATAYAVHIAGLYRHYRLRYWLHLQRTYPKAAVAMRRWTEPRTDPEWQRKFFSDGTPQARELRFWLAAP